MECARECRRLGKVQSRGDLHQWQIGVLQQLTCDPEPDLVRNGLEAGSLRLEVTVERASMNGQAARHLRGGAPCLHELGPQKPAQLVLQVRRTGVLAPDNLELQR